MLSPGRVRRDAGRRQHSLHSHRHCGRPAVYRGRQEQEGRQEDVRYCRRQGSSQHRLLEEDEDPLVWNLALH